MALDGVDLHEAFGVWVIEPRLGVVHLQHIVPVVAGVVELRVNAAVAAGNAQSLFVGDLAPLIIVGAAHHAAKLIRQVGGVAQTVLVQIVLQDIFLDVLAPPIRALAGDLHAQLVKAVHPAVIKAALFLHDQGLEGGGGVVNDVALLDHFGLINARLHGRRFVVEVGVAVGVVLHDQLTAHPEAKAVVGVKAALTQLVFAVHHVVGLVVDVGLLVLPSHAGGGAGVLVVRNEVAPAIVGVLPEAGADGVGDRAALGALVQSKTVVFVLHAAVLLLADQVAQRIVLIRAGGVQAHPFLVGGGDAVEAVVGVGGGQRRVAKVAGAGVARPCGIYSSISLFCDIFSPSFDSVKTEEPALCLPNDSIVSNI